jgi:hypothetical protein
MIWGAVGLGYKSGLVFFDGALNSQGYIDYLKDSSIFEEMRKAFEDRCFSFPLRRCVASDSRKGQEIL